MNVRVIRPTIDEFQRFVRYVVDWYVDPEGIDPASFTVAEVRAAAVALSDNYAATESIHPLGIAGEMKWYGDSHDRDIVRDIILRWRGERRVEHAAIVDLIVAVTPAPVRRG